MNLLPLGALPGSPFGSISRELIAGGLLILRSHLSTPIFDRTYLKRIDLG